MLKYDSSNLAETVLKNSRSFHKLFLCRIGGSQNSQHFRKFYISRLSFGTDGFSLFDEILI